MYTDPLSGIAGVPVPMFSPAVVVPAELLRVAPLTLVGVIAPRERLIEGVEVGLATVPETPLAEATETEVTVPVLPPPGGVTGI